MNKKGFTLVELLGVIAILAVITTIAFISIGAAVGNTKKKLLESKKLEMETAAINYVENEKITLDSSDCTKINSLKGTSYNHCKTFTLQELLDKEYFTTNDKDQQVKNDVTGKSMYNDKVTVYRKNNRLYAEVTCLESNDEAC